MSLALRTTIAATIAAVCLVLPSTSSAAVFGNPNPITINQEGLATPYPSTVEVSGLRGPISDIKLTLHRFGHTRPKDVDMLLVSPVGDASYVMSDICDAPVEDYTWTFHSNGGPGAGFMDGDCGNFHYWATDKIEPQFPDFFLGAPPPPTGAQHYYAGLNAFHGESANGTWRLFVVDDETGEAGDIELGWTLDIATAAPAIDIPETRSAGDPYPLTKTVSGMEGVITDVNIGLRGLTHFRPDDLDMLLVGPQGQKVLLASDACGDVGSAAQSWLFDDEAPAPIPDGAACEPTIVATKRFQPADHEAGDDLPAPAPPGPYSTKLSDFDLTDPNGEWKLYVFDDTAGKDGFLGQPFLIDFATRPKATVAMGAATATVAEGASSALSLTRSATGPLGPATVKVESAPGTATAGADYTPISQTVSFAAGETTKTVPVSALADDQIEPDETYTVSISSPTGDGATGAQTTTTVTIADRTPRPAPPSPQPPSGGSGGGNGNAGGGPGGSTTGGGTTSGGTTGGSSAGGTGDGTGGGTVGRRGPRVAIAPARVRLDRRGTARIRLTCPRTADRRCAGVLRLQVQRGRRHRTLATRLFRVPAGRSITTRVRMPASVKRAANRSAQRVRAVAVTNDVSSTNPTTTARTITVVRPAKVRR